MRGTLPFPLLGMDSDTGAEFTEAHLIEYRKRERVTFTRGRPYEKNDNCQVERKNWTAARQYAGYMRHDPEEELAILGELYSHLFPTSISSNPKPSSSERSGSEARS